MPRNSSRNAPFVLSVFKDAEEQRVFADAYNDTASFPSVKHVADRFGVQVQTAKNYASMLRGLRSQEKNVPEIKSRVRSNTIETLFLRDGVNNQAEDAPEAKRAPPQPQPEEITIKERSNRRAGYLKSALHADLKRGRWPIANPDALVCAGQVLRVYKNGEVVEREGAPRSHICGELAAAPIRDARNRKFLITGAQNDTPINEPFWRNLLAYAEYLGAEIIVGAWTYETMWTSENSPAARNFAPEICDHICFGRMEIGDNFAFCGNINTLPTATRPLDGVTTHTRGRHACFPHIRLQLQTLPTNDPDAQASIMMTTGAVTRPKVAPRKAGARAVFDHVFGASVVEFDDDGRCFMRQINATEDGAFHDLTIRVENGRVIEGVTVRAITFADLHISKLGTRNCKAVFGFDPKTYAASSGSLIDALRPEFSFIHDGHDQEHGSHHRVGDGHFGFMLAMRNRSSIEEEIARLGRFLCRLERLGQKIVMVESNHDLAFNRYIKEGRYRNDGVNALFGAKVEVAMLEHQKVYAAHLDAEMKPPQFSPLEWVLRQMFGSALDHVTWVYDGSSFLIDGIECGVHGFRGANGSKGTVEGFAKQARKMTIGDKHSPQIVDGVYVAGAMELHHGYNVGPSGWAVAHVIQHHNGKRQLIVMQDGKWRA